MSEGEIHVGELDASATLAMDELMALAGQMDVEIDASQVMSKAIRMYFWIVAGGVTVTPTKARAGGGDGGRHPRGHGAALGPSG